MVEKKVSNKRSKGISIVIAFIFITIIIFSVLIPFIIIRSTTPNYSNISAVSASALSSERELQVQEVESGDPSISAFQGSQGQVYLCFHYKHGLTPITIIGVYYFCQNTGKWVSAYPRPFTVTGNERIYLFTPIEYTGLIEIVTSLGNIFYTPVSTIGASASTNIYCIIQTTSTPSYVITPCGKTIILPNGTEIITPCFTLPKLAKSNSCYKLPKCTKLILPCGKVCNLPNGGILHLNNNLLKQKYINSAYFPFSSFLTGYQSDNDNIGPLPVGQRNPELNTQTIVQWFIASGNLAPICIYICGLAPSTVQENTVYISKYAPTGGYITWTGDAGLIVGAGKIGLVDPPPPSPKPSGPQSPPYYVAFTVHLANGSWATIVDTTPIPVVGKENGQPASPLTLAVGVFNSKTGTLCLYINGTLVSKATVNCKKLCVNPLSYFDVGSAYNGGGNPWLCELPGFPGDMYTGGNNLYSFNGALGPTIIYNTSLTPYQIKSLFIGCIPSPDNIVILWSQNSAEYVHICTSTWTVTPCYKYCSNPPGGPPGKCPYGEYDYEVFNLANLCQFNGFWGLAGAIPTSFAPFSDVVLWGGASPIVLNPSALVHCNVNITVRYSACLIPTTPGGYTFSVNFTDPLPGATVERNVQTVTYANEWATVYINGQKVFEGEFVNNQLHVLYSNIPCYQQKNIPMFGCYLKSPVNITVIFTFNMYEGSANNQPVGPVGPQSSCNYPVVYFNIMWLPPGAQWLTYIPITQLEPYQV
ncbi:hypothetical protein D1867_10885 [Acidianus infernus]|uniref:Uncharacterized protein n=1 Tax=Acidianus infernus TaxID=12915 RepID=A0A6A9QKH9_ACIIN|nr:hypothetical protein [Acidianus infernus]MUM65736.1 hypothetical protein [Acidianus infernus]